MKRFSTGPGYRQLLVDLLSETYPPDHRLVAYEAATLPIGVPRMETVKLSDLGRVDLRFETTLVVPPSEPLICNTEMMERIAALEE